MPLDIYEYHGSVLLMFAFTTRNTIGFKYWLVRFFCQCCFYLLVLVTVLMQAYDNELQSSEAMYIAIISGSAVFLYLELIQCFKGWAYYFKYAINLSPLCYSSELHIIEMMCLLIPTLYEQFDVQHSRSIGTRLPTRRSNQSAPHPTRCNFIRRCNHAAKCSAFWVLCTLGRATLCKSKEKKIDCVQAMACSLQLSN